MIKIVDMKYRFSSWGSYTKELRKLTTDELVLEFQKSREDFRKYCSSAIIRYQDRIKKVLRERKYDTDLLYESKVKDNA